MLVREAVPALEAHVEPWLAFLRNVVVEITPQVGNLCGLTHAFFFVFFGTAVTGISSFRIDLEKEKYALVKTFSRRLAYAATWMTYFSAGRVVVAAYRT